MKDENQKPVIASTLPWASIGSLTGKPTFSILTFEASILFACTKIGHCAHAPSAAGAPSTLPSRSLGALMPFFFSVTIEKAGVSYTIITAFTGRLRGSSRYLMSELISAKPTSYAPEATRLMPSTEPEPGSTVTSSPSAL